MKQILVGVLAALVLAGCAAPGYYAAAPRWYPEAPPRHRHPDHWGEPRVIVQPVYVVPARPYR